jgi:cytochrome P450 family 6
MGCIFETLDLYVGALTACVLAVLYVYFKLSTTYWKKRNVPYVAPKFPFGNFADALFNRKSVGDVCEDLYKKLDGEKYIGAYGFAKPMFIIRDPDIIKNILVKDFASFHDRGLLHNEELEPMTGNLFLLPGKKWKNLRVKLSPTFTSGKMKMMFQTIVECGIELGKLLEKSACNEEIIEIKDILARYGTDVISSCAFGIQCNSLKNPDAEVRQQGKIFFDPSIRIRITGVLNRLCPRAMSWLRIDPMDPKASNYFRNTFKEVMIYRERNKITRNDFMQLLIQIKNKVNLGDETEILEMNGQGNLDNKTSESGKHF